MLRAAFEEGAVVDAAGSDGFGVEFVDCFMVSARECDVDMGRHLVPLSDPEVRLFEDAETASLAELHAHLIAERRERFFVKLPALRVIFNCDDDVIQHRPPSLIVRTSMYSPQ